MRFRSYFVRFVKDSTDAQLERRFGFRLVQRAIFVVMARMYRPDRGFGFARDIVFELGYPVSDRKMAVWTVSVREGRARAHRGPGSKPALTIRLGLPDFIRIAAGELDPSRPLMAGRLDFEGDLILALRLGHMFGRP